MIAHFVVRGLTYKPARAKIPVNAKFWDFGRFN